VVNNDKKLNPPWSHEVKDAISAKNLLYKAWHQKKAETFSHLWYAEA